MAKKPATIIYAVDESPPFWITVMNGFQQVGVVATALVYALLVFRVVGAPIDVMTNLIAVGMWVLGIGTVLQAIRLGPVGSGFMCPATFTATYLAPSLMAARTGGLALVFGMTMFAGAVELAIAPFLTRLRAIFPPEVSGVVIFIIGLTGGIAGLRSLLGDNEGSLPSAEWIVAGITLGTMVALNVWGTGPARMFCALIGLTVGYVAAIIAGLFDSQALADVAALPWIGLPKISFARSFDLSLALPFAIGSLATAMKAAGTITICQKTNDADWVRPDMKTITSGVIADALSTVIAGAAGTVGTNTGTPGVGLAAATGVTSRTVAYAAAIIFMIMGFVPKLSALLGLMPRPVVVAALLFIVSFIMINGLQIMTSRMLDVRRTVVIGLAVLGGMAVEVFPATFRSAPEAIAPLVNNSLVLGAMLALILNLVFRIGVKKTARLTVEGPVIEPQKVQDFFDVQGAKWGARPDVVKRAAYGTIQLLDALESGALASGPIDVEASFDEFNLDVRASYIGPALTFPDERPTPAQIRNSEDGTQLLAGFMLRRNADRVKSETANGRSQVLFHFIP